MGGWVWEDEGSEVEDDTRMLACEGERWRREMGQVGDRTGMMETSALSLVKSVSELSEKG